MSGHAKSSYLETNRNGRLQIDQLEREHERFDSELQPKKRPSVFERLSSSLSPGKNSNVTVCKKETNLPSTSNHQQDVHAANVTKFSSSGQKRRASDDDFSDNKRHRSEKNELINEHSVFQRLQKNSVDTDEKNLFSISHSTTTSRRNHSAFLNHRRRNQSKFSHLSIPFSKPIVHCYGDSFVGTLTLVDSRVLFVEKFKGASAKGLNNAASKLGIGKKLVKTLTQEKPKNVLLIFGNVDFHINFLYQLQTKKELALGPDEFTDQVFDNYTTFLQSQILAEMVNGKEEDGKCFIEKLLISSVIHPIVHDQYLSLSIQKYTENEAIANGDFNVTRIPIDELLKNGENCHFHRRLDMVLKFNEKLKSWCSKHPKVCWIDVNKHISEPSTKQVKREFCDKDPTNIHILWEQTVEFWLEEIKNQGISGIDAKHITVDLKKSADAYSIEKIERMKNHPITSILVKNGL